MRGPMKRPAAAVLGCAVASAMLVLGAWQTGQPPHQSRKNINSRERTAMEQAGGISRTGPGAQPEPTELQNPVASSGVGPPPGVAPGSGPAVSGTGSALGTNQGTFPTSTTGGGEPPGGPPAAQGALGPAVGTVAPQQGAPDVGGVLGPGAVPGPGGTPGAYATPGEEQYWYMAAPKQEHGKELIRRYGCGTCHTIAGIREARGLVGPPLTGVASRAYIAGVLQNTVRNRARWIENPQAFVPNVIMPNMGLTRADANDIAAYLETLHERPQ